MRKLILLLFVFLLINIPTHADYDEYQLREPDAEEYLRAIPTIFDVFNEGSPEHIAREYLMRLVYRELNERYPDFVSEDFTLVRDALSHLQLGFVGLTPIFGQDINTYDTLLIEALFLDEPIDLATVETIEVEPFRIDVIPVDLDGDDDPEFLLDIYTQDSHLFKIFDANDSQSSGYRMVETPPLWFSYDCDFRSVCGGNGTVFSTEDINADGLRELVFAVGSYCGYGECGGHLSFWAWRDGEMISILDDAGEGPFWTGTSGGGTSALLPPEGTWRFETIDGDEALELIQRREFTDNRGCDVVRTTVFDWQVTQDQYMQGDIDTSYADTGACGLRQGHKAFRDGDYPTAIEAYTLATNLLTAEDQGEALQYAKVRLALAYALNGNRSEALLHIAQLQQVEPETEVIRRFIDTFADYFEANNLVELCVEMREAFADPRSSNVGASDVFTFGNLDNVSGRGSYVGGDFGPDATGCNLASFLRVRISQLDMNANTLIEDIQRRIGNISASLEFDFDQDGDDDWLLWFDAPFTETVVIVNQPDFPLDFVYFLPPPTQEITYDFHAIVDATFLVQHIQEDSEARLYCSDNVDSELIQIYLWTDNASFYNIFSGFLCQQRTLEEIFTEPTQMIVWDYINASVGAVESSFIWDSITRRFIFDQYLEDPPDLRRGNFECSPYAKGPYFCGFSEDYDIALERADEVLANPPDHLDFDMTIAIRYLRALALESLNRPDEAVAEYVAIYEVAPDSAWGMLAALHFEPAE